MVSIIDLLTRHSSDINAFYTALFDALKDGKLTEAEIADLEKKREELRISEKALQAMRMQAYMFAFAKATEDQEVTDDELDEMEQVQDYLGLTDADVSRTKKELFRMRILSEIKKGNLPVVQTDDVVLDPTETAHWSASVMLETEEEKKSRKQKGTLIITNKRIVCKGDEMSVAVPLSSIIDVDYAIDGMTVHLNRRKPLNIQYQEKGDHNVVASILASAIDLRKR
ncbi:MAG TPA: hypothetical protein VHA78_01370 [Candidatus Peribacteraceae bacterium]|nr:hypothetical protein [Candidatus Peribacteraceae bacterium]